ncbi:MAG: hypothetical protein LW832_02230 [Parachlamydia sp.]|nr:hypothetical protein [Parachlamydia sp.]
MEQKYYTLNESIIARLDFLLSVPSKLSFSSYDIDNILITPDCLMTALPRFSSRPKEYIKFKEVLDMLNNFLWDNPLPDSEIKCRMIFEKKEWRELKTKINELRSLISYIIVQA